ncbi:MAG: hypothetical protein ACOX3G_05740 [Armatimonadota bacterium]
MRTWLLLLLIFLLPAKTLAVGKVTVDPNLPNQSQEIDDPGKTDNRLSQKITYSASACTMASILDDLTAASGITFKAGKNNSHWQVRDRKMTISVADVPLSQLMGSIARIMKFKWRRSGEEGKWIYRLDLDYKFLLNEEAKHALSDQRIEEAKAKKRAEGLEQYEKLRYLTKEEKNDLRKTNPYLYVIAESGLGKSLGKFFEEVPAVFDAIANGHMLELEGSSLSTAAQSSLMALMKDMHTFDQIRLRNDRPELDILNPSKVTIEINESLDPDSPFSMPTYQLGEIRVRYYHGQIDLDLLDPLSKTAQATGSVLLDAREQQQGRYKLREDQRTEIWGARTTDLQEEVEPICEPFIEHPGNPDYCEKITLDTDSRQLPDLQLAFAKATKLSIVSDYYGAMDPLLGVLHGEAQIRRVLDSLCKTFNYNWDKQEEIIEFQDRYWYTKRLNLIQESRIEAWREEVRKNGSIGLDSLAQISLLTDGQYEQNIKNDEELSRPAAHVKDFGNPEILKLYASLRQDQRTAMLSSGGLDLSTLSEEQYALIKKPLQKRLGNETLKAAHIVSIVCKKEPGGWETDDDAIFYTFTPKADGEIGPEWVLPALVSLDYLEKNRISAAKNRRIKPAAKPRHPARSRRITSQFLSFHPPLSF